MLINVPRRALATSATVQLQPLSSAKLQVSLTKTPKKQQPNKELLFGRAFSDHMLAIDWDQQTGWHKPQIQDYGRLQLDPSSTVFHYALGCFEGMKAYKDSNGQIRLFRPDMNMKRLLRSCTRLSLPTFDPEEYLKCLKHLLRLDQKWIPAERGYSLYIRPTVIATQESLGVGASSRAKFFTILSPVGPYYPTGFAAVSLLADPANIRAWPGGVGDCKVAGNYAPGILPQIRAAAEGFQQNLWLFPADHKGSDYLLTEVGTMNLFVVLKDASGNHLELATPKLDGTILPGVTRDSILHLARQSSAMIDGGKPIRVSERRLTMSELLQASDEGRLVEMFGSGTAAIVSPIKKIRYVTRKDPSSGKIVEYKDINVPLDPKNPNEQAGPLARHFSQLIMSIQYGEQANHPWSVLV